MEFTKIKYDPKTGEVFLRWETPGAIGTDRHELTSKDAPHADFTAALEALAPVVGEALRLDHDPDFDADELQIRGVTLKDAPDPGEPGELVPGICITALRPLPWSNAPLVINTPFAPVDALPVTGLQRKVDRLCEEARRYVKGKRQQGDLFAGDGEDAEAEASPAETIRGVADRYGATATVRPFSPASA